MDRFKSEDYRDIIAKELTQDEELNKSYIEAELEYELKKIKK